MLPTFQQFLVDKGFIRTCQRFGKTVEDYNSISVSAYGPLTYDFKHPGYSKYVYFGLCVKDKSPYLHTGCGDEFKLTGNNDIDFKNLIEIIK